MRIKPTFRLYMSAVCPQTSYNFAESVFVFISNKGITASQNCQDNKIFDRKVFFKMPSSLYILLQQYCYCSLYTFICLGNW